VRLRRLYPAWTPMVETSGGDIVLLLRPDLAFAVP
jgi:hypothetical protein